MVQEDQAGFLVPDLGHRLVLSVTDVVQEASAALPVDSGLLKDLALPVVAAPVALEVPVAVL